MPEGSLAASPLSTASRAPTRPVRRTGRVGGCSRSFACGRSRRYGVLRLEARRLNAANTPAITNAIQVGCGASVWQPPELRRDEVWVADAPGAAPEVPAVPGS